MQVDPAACAAQGGELIIVIDTGQELRCTLPPISTDEASKKKNAIIKSSDELLKSFGYRRPVNN